MSDFACRPVSQPSNTPPIVRTTSGSNVTLSCSFKADPPPTIEWSWQGGVIRNTSEPLKDKDVMYVVREWGHYTKTSILTIFNALQENRGQYKCKGVNSAGEMLQSRIIEFVKPDVMEQLVRIKLYMIAAVGGCIVLFFSLIVAGGILHLRRKQGHKYRRQGSWCDSDSTCGDRTFFMFSVSGSSTSNEHIECKEIPYEVKNSNESLQSDSLSRSPSYGYSDSSRNDVSQSKQYFHSKGFYHSVPSQCHDERSNNVKMLFEQSNVQADAECENLCDIRRSQFLSPQHQNQQVNSVRSTCNNTNEYCR